MTRAEVKSRSESLAGKFEYIVFGIPIGWMAAHYFVDLYSGAWPTTSIVQFSIDCTTGTWDFLKVMGIASIPALIAIYNSFLKSKRRMSD